MSDWLTDGCSSDLPSRIADRLARAGLPLFAQHVDPLDTGTLVDIFRADPHASLLGTDALRDGVDVPGDSLRLVVMEGEIGRAHGCTPVTNAHLVCRLLLEQTTRARARVEA